MTLERLKSAHQKSQQNKALIEKSDQCGCFYCLEIYDSNEIVDWDFGDVAGGGFGVNIGFAHPLSESVDFIGELGFNAYGGVQITVLSNSVEVQWYGIPVGVGVRLNANEKLFLQAKGGIIYKTGEVTDNLGNKEDSSETVAK